ncbi:hypothetical protein [Microcoleus vaginatus]|uniref:hypothetical protein n=1 Tax=Microcoleus vaginatus TaxID=119532 RepID=UPI001F6062FD|nr:hypothetical protein D0A37_26155 [Microcoleus vaginatus HSN003]
MSTFCHGTVRYWHEEHGSRYLTAKAKAEPAEEQLDRYRQQFGNCYNLSSVGCVINAPTMLTEKEITEVPVI